MSNKMYLGDSVYADYDDYQITLTTENGAHPSNTIIIDHDVLHNLIHFLEKNLNLKIKIERLNADT